MDDLNRKYIAEANAVIAVVNTEGYQILLREMKLLFDNEYMKLRKASRTDGTLHRIQGFLDGVERCMGLPQEINNRKSELVNINIKEEAGRRVRNRNTRTNPIKESIIQPQPTRIGG